MNFNDNLLENLGRLARRSPERATTFVITAGLLGAGLKMVVLAAIAG